MFWGFMSKSAWYSLYSKQGFQHLDLCHLHCNKMSDIKVASFQAYTLFGLHLTTIHRNRRVANNREGLGEFFTWVILRERRRGGAQLQASVNMVEQTCLQHLESRQAVKFPKPSRLEELIEDRPNWLWALPLPTSISCPPDVVHVMNYPRPSPFHAALPPPCITVNTNWRGNTG